MPGGRAGDRPESHCGSALWRGEWECPGAAISQRQTRWVAPTPGAPLCPQVPRRDAKAFLGSRPRHSAWPCVLVRGLRLGRDLGWRREGRPELLSARREHRGRVRLDFARVEVLVAAASLTAGGARTAEQRRRSGCREPGERRPDTASHGPPRTAASLVPFLPGFLAGNRGGAGRYHRPPRVRTGEQGEALCPRLPPG